LGLRVDRLGRIVDCSVHRSSGSMLIDEAALALACTEDRLPAPPSVFRGGVITLYLPIGLSKAGGRYLLSHPGQDCPPCGNVMQEERRR
jgi:hypothetical protein